MKIEEFADQELKRQYMSNAPMTTPNNKPLRKWRLSSDGNISIIDPKKITENIAIITKALAVNEYNALVDLLKAEREKCKVLEEALRFYADADNYEMPTETACCGIAMPDEYNNPICCMNPIQQPIGSAHILSDKGEKARIILHGF